MKKMKEIFLKGLTATLPIGISLYVIFWLISKVEDFFSVLLRAILHDQYYIPGLGLAFGLVVIYLTGLTLNTLIMEKIAELTRHLIDRTPFIKTIYGPLKELMGLFKANDQAQAHQKVVLIPFQNQMALGLVTRDLSSPLGQDEELRHLGNGDLVAVYVPLSYALGGTTVLVKKSEAVEVNISVEKAMKLAITAWVGNK